MYTVPVTLCPRNSPDVYCPRNSPVTLAAFLDREFDDAPTYAALRKAETIGRPVGTPEWLSDSEQRTGLTLAPQKRGPKPKSEACFSGFSKVSA